VKRHRVRISEDAELDLVDLYHHIAAHDSVEHAVQVLDQLEALCASLAELPERGHVPPELDRIGVMVFREVHFKPYRVIYEVRGASVFIHCVVDGRRDMQSLLERRLLR
jgi:toxin ParE1/3/4